MIYMLRILTEKVGKMQEDVGNIHGEMESLRRNIKRDARDKNTVTEIKDAQSCVSCSVMSDSM